MSVYLALEDTANHLTNRDLLSILRVTENTNQEGGKVYIRPGSWQVLVEAPEIYYPKVVEALRSMSYECTVFSGEIKTLSTFLLVRKGGKRDAT